MIEPRAKNLLKATSINQLGMTERHTPPATTRVCPDCGCKMSRYTPWTQDRCCPCDMKHQASLPKTVQRILGIPPRPKVDQRWCEWCEGQISILNSHRQVYCSARCSDTARRIADRARARERRQEKQ